MEESEAIVIKGKIVSGVLALTSRTFLLQLISFFGTFLLTVLLSPAIFGVFFLVTAIISFLSYFSDIGLAAALVQKKEEPDRKEWVTAFTIQQALVIGIVFLVLVVSPSIIKFYKLEKEGLTLLRALLFSFFLSSLKTIPSVQLERKLEFKLLVIPQILETLTFYAVAIVLAVFGLGISSFAWAAVLRGIVGVIAIYLISPWQVGLGIYRSAASSLLSFGMPFQANSVLAFIKDDLITLFLGKILPFNQVGYIGWAKKWSEVFLRLIMDSVIRVSFPAYSRLQGNIQLLRRAIEKSLFFLALIIFPATILLVFLIRPLVEIVPKYQKWEPALFSFYLFSIASLPAALSSPLVNALNALGKIKTTLFLMTFWTVLTWIFVPILVMIFGFNGVSMAAILISTTGFLPFVLLKKIIPFKVVSSIYKPLVSTLVMAVPVYLLSNFQSKVGLIFALSVSITIYVSVIWFWARGDILPYIKRPNKER